MEAINHYEGYVVPILNDNIDTDQIIPKNFLKRIEKTGFGQFLFDEWRYLDNRDENPDFILNNEEYKNATILLTGDNFGCGSSREHAVWALDDYGFRVIIAGGYSDIFYMNSINNGLLPIILPKEEREKIAKVKATDTIKIELDNQLIKVEDESIHFDIDKKWRDKLISGLDEIDETMAYKDQILAYEKAHGI
ncbi:MULTISPECIES: 3-isopropylmalate dehydratase small subunit [Vagococcus]|uniref:3-isopropylmalate dehydratase small subunit n=1 Tax=Vagococcus TaxID=2737 RepID=UPI000E535F0D|nr:MULTISPECIES: 3-isopropylmalate dehydratase small subunit [Vagococcus]RHH70203.1 3-isopropylmalate dehydratase small subunit [Vagococcus sp. AM17-17]